jgi:hypothetical protein
VVQVITWRQTGFPLNQQTPEIANAKYENHGTSQERIGNSGQMYSLLTYEHPLWSKINGEQSYDNKCGQIAFDMTSIDHSNDEKEE